MMPNEQKTINRKLIDFNIAGFSLILLQKLLILIIHNARKITNHNFESK